MRVNCDFCTKPIDIQDYKTRRNKHQFCSVECVRRFRNKKQKITCPTCREEFEVKSYRLLSKRPIFCSKKCQFAKGRVITNCAYCGKQITKKLSVAKERSYCNQKCQHNWLSENLYGEKHPNWTGTQDKPRGKNWLKMRRKTLERDAYRCRLCESTNGISVHHLIPIRLFDDPEQANILDNLVSLCRPCHSKVEPRKSNNPINDRLKIMVQAHGDADSVHQILVG